MIITRRTDRTIGCGSVETVNSSLGSVKPHGTVFSSINFQCVQAFNIDVQSTVGGGNCGRHSFYFSSMRSRDPPYDQFHEIHIPLSFPLPLLCRFVLQKDRQGVSLMDLLVDREQLRNASLRLLVDCVNL